ncbi:MAG: TatD family hydrolase, partial [Elusimicrobiota bacterium]|nr:TatD family hydrolase [Elusimicrobiota bacterium]
MVFIDSHAHINDPAFDVDRDEVIQNAFAAGLSHIIEIACEPGEWQSGITLAEKYKNKIYPVCGLHPIAAAQFKETHLPVLKTFLQSPLTRAVGEIGLDYFYEDSSPKQTQRQALDAMLALAAEVKKPVVLHCRKGKEENDFSAYKDLFAALKTANLQGGVMHCFSGRYEDAKAALDLGLLIGVTGIVGYKKNNDLRETFKKIGLNYLMLETDCPYLPPQSKRGLNGVRGVNKLMRPAQ